MEKVLCTVHDTLCMLKTGVKDGPTKGKSFYVCVDKHSCDFSQQASVSPSHCLHHEDSMVELQALSYSQQQQSHRLYYRCVVGKKAGQRWCGSVPWTAPGIEKRSPLSDAQLQPSCLPPVRNPFKVPSKTNKTQAGGEENGSETSHKKAERKEKRQKENAVDAGVKAEEEEEGKLKDSDTYRGKQLPPGMKVKKRVSSEEKADQVGEITDKIKDLTKKEQKEAGEHNMDLPHFEKVKKTSLDLDKTTEDKTRPVTQLDESSVQNGSALSPPGVPGVPSLAPEADRADDDVVLVSVKPAPRRTPPSSAVQKTLTCFPGFQAGDPRGMRGLLSAQLQQKKATLSSVNVAALPDNGERLRTQVRELEDALDSLSLGAHPESPQGSNGGVPGPIRLNPFGRPGGAILLPSPPPPGPPHPPHQPSGSSLGLQPGQGGAQVSGDSQTQGFYGGRMTNDRLLAVKNATCEAIDHLHKSLESCPDPESEAPDPRGIKVSLLAHQRRALAWLLWRETQNPCGGILADDMGLGKTLTMIALILAQKKKTKEKDEKKEEKEPDGWISKTDSSVVVSKGTLIICPASLIHHWTREVDRHVKKGLLTVYLYHGAGREKSAKVLADYDLVVTTYSLVSKEIPAQREDVGESAKDPDHVVPASAE